MNDNQQAQARIDAEVTSDENGKHENGKRQFNNKIAALQKQAAIEEFQYFQELANLERGVAPLPVSASYESSPHMADVAKLVTPVTGVQLTESSFSPVLEPEVSAYVASILAGLKNIGSTKARQAWSNAIIRTQGVIESNAAYASSVLSSSSLLSDGPVDLEFVDEDNLEEDNTASQSDSDTLTAQSGSDESDEETRSFSTEFKIDTEATPSLTDSKVDTHATAPTRSELKYDHESEVAKERSRSRQSQDTQAAQQSSTRRAPVLAPTPSSKREIERKEKKYLEKTPTSTEMRRPTLTIPVRRSRDPEVFALQQKLMSDGQFFGLNQHKMIVLARSSYDLAGRVLDRRYGTTKDQRDIISASSQVVLAIKYGVYQNEYGHLTGYIPAKCSDNCCAFWNTQSKTGENTPQVQINFEI